MEYFDDSTFDDYPNEGWIAKKTDEDGNARKLTGKGLKISGDSWTYESIEIIDYNPDKESFAVIWKKTKERAELRRVYICFDAEDPRKYIERVINAFQERLYADSVIRYEFYIDNMPLNNADLPELDQEQKRRLEAMAKTKKIK